LTLPNGGIALVLIGNRRAPNVPNLTGLKLARVAPREKDAVKTFP
jgi:hypothetical protein